MRSWRKSEAGSFARIYAWLVVRLRWFVVVGWAAGAIAAAVWLPATTPAAGVGWGGPHAGANSGYAASRRCTSRRRGSRGIPPKRSIDAPTGSVAAWIHDAHYRR